MTTATMAQTQEQLKALRLHRTAERLDGVLEEAAKGEWTDVDLIRRLVEEELQAKREKTVAMRTALARFPYVKTLESFDFKFQPSLDAKRVRDLAACRFIPNGENVVLLGLLLTPAAFLPTLHPALRNRAAPHRLWRSQSSGTLVDGRGNRFTRHGHLLQLL